MGDPNRSTLILFAHPYPHLSRINVALKKAVASLPSVSIVDLYQTYPDALIDIKKEQDLLKRHQLIVFQHPLYWYSCPPMLKEWIDCVLLQGFAFGKGGDALQNKDFLQVISTGAPWTTYQRQGAYRFTVEEILRPFEATVHLCQMRYHYPFLVQGIKSLNKEQIDAHAQAYRKLLQKYQAIGRQALVEFDSAQEESTRKDPYL